eukprot:9451048-Ditylum_brightwellii.AAC.1
MERTRKWIKGITYVTSDQCPYRDKRKFLHKGDGCCLPSSDNGNDSKGGKRKQKCFTFKKKGKCKLGAIRAL